MRDSLSNTSDFDDDTQFLHFSIIIGACRADTSINRNAMHILYFIITSFAFVEMIFMLCAAAAALPYAHLLISAVSLSLSPYREFCVNIKWNFISSIAVCNCQRLLSLVLLHSFLIFKMELSTIQSLLKHPICIHYSNTLLKCD
jgi:hypothetical protein